VRTAILAAVAAVALLAGCGQRSTQRQAVATYLKKVDQIERQLVRPLSTVTSTGRQFAQEQRAGGTLTGLLTSSHEQQLLHADAQITAARAHLAAVHAPVPASKLRVLLLQIVDGQMKLTRELAQLVSFLPRYTAALRPLGPATLKLEAALTRQTAVGPAGVAAVYAAKAAALRRFKAAVDGILNQLRQLQPPLLQRPGYRTQLASLHGMSTSAARLANSLHAGPQGNVQQLLSEFDRAATLNQTVGAQKAQIAAIRAYDGEIVRLNHLTRAAEQERLRLANNLA
jgi:hypothetical protein